MRECWLERTVFTLKIERDISDGARPKAVIQLVAMYRRRIEIAKATMLWSSSDTENLEMSVKIWLLTKELK